MKRYIPILSWLFIISYSAWMGFILLFDGSLRYFMSFFPVVLVILLLREYRIDRENKLLPWFIYGTWLVMLFIGGKFYFELINTSWI